MELDGRKNQTPGAAEGHTEARTARHTRDGD